MSVEFNADEVFEMAEQMEANGANFYLKAAEQSGDNREKALLLRLNTMEQAHLKMFQQMRSELSNAESRPIEFDPFNEAVLYVRALADSKVFDLKSDPWKALTGSESIRDILLIAIGLERDSIAYYSGIRDLVPPELGRDKVERIIREEMGHITVLNKYIAEHCC